MAAIGVTAAAAGTAVKFRAAAASAGSGSASEVQGNWKSLQYTEIGFIIIGWSDSADQAILQAS